MDGGEVKISAPGKVILHGEHAVVYGKVAIAASLNLRCYVTCKQVSGSSLVKLELPDVGLSKSLNVRSLCEQLKTLCTCESIKDPSAATEESLSALRSYARICVLDDPTDTQMSCLLTFIYLYLAICARESNPPGLEVHMKSDIPVGAGLGSSAAFSVCLSAALLQLSGLVQSEKQEDGTAGWSETDRELINKWAFVGEKIIHGKPSGIDNSVSTFGGALRFQQGVISKIENMPTISVMLVNTRVPRSTKVLVEGFRQRYTKYPTVFGPLLESVEAIAERALENYAKIFQHKDTEECIASLGELVDLNHQILNMMGVGHRSLDQVVTTAHSHSLHGKLTGAGGGGCAYVILPPAITESVTDSLGSELESQGYQVWKRTSVGSPGVMQHC